VIHKIAEIKLRRAVTDAEDIQIAEPPDRRTSFDGNCASWAD
jgi:hypothetical protein